MPRPLRPQLAGGIYHVTSRGNRRSAIYVDDLDRRTFLTHLARVVDQYSWECFAFCLMTTHFHLLVRTELPNIAAGMQSLKSRYAKDFNHRHALSGHVFQARYHSVLVRTKEHLLELYRYIALNPVRAGACRSPADWPWGSYAVIAGSQALFVRDTGSICTRTSAAGRQESGDCVRSSRQALRRSE